MAGTRTVQDVPIAKLRFDPDNPRLPHTVDGHDETAVLEWMLVDESLAELLGSIASQGYFPGEPILVTPVDAKGPPYIVVEGNRRLAAVRLLNDPDFAPVRRRTVEAIVADAAARPSALPALIFDERDEILDYLGYRHVTGVKEWDPLAKARYLRQLAERAAEQGETLNSQQLAKRIGSRADYVDRLLEGLNIYDHAADRRFYDLEGVNEDTISFAVLTTALSYEKIEDFVFGPEGDPATAAPVDENLRDLVDWMFRKRESGSTVLGESRNLGQLASVVTSPEARSALKDGTNLSDAALLTDEPLRSFLKTVRQAVDKVRLAQGMTHRISEASEADFSVVADLVARARDLASVIRGKVDRDDPTI